MGNTTINTTPSRTFNWADDEDDDFDLDAWKANTAQHVSAPSLEELGPLQLPFDEDVPLITVASKSSAPKTKQQPPSGAEELPEEIESWQLEESEDSGYQVFHCIENRLPDPPAYPELSAYDDKTPSPDVRKNYASHWTAMKVKSGRDCRVPVLYKSSRLVEVQGAYEEDIDVDTPEKKSNGETPSEQCCNKVQCDEDEDVYDPQLSAELSPIIEYIFGHQSKDDKSFSSPENSRDVNGISRYAHDAQTMRDISTRNLYDELSTLFPNRAVSIADGDFEFADIFTDNDDEDSNASGIDEDCISDSPSSPLDIGKERMRDLIETASQPTVVRLHPSTSFTNDDDEATSPIVCLVEDMAKESNAESTMMERKDSMDALDECTITASLTIESRLRETPPVVEEKKKEKFLIVQNLQEHTNNQLPTLYSTFLSRFAEDCSCALPQIDTSSHKNVEFSPPATQTASPDTNGIPSMSEHISSAVSTSWSTLSSQPWTAVGIATAGVVVGSLIRFARRR